MGHHGRRHAARDTLNIFVNLPVADLGRSRAFFCALGFVVDDRFADDTAFSLQLSDKANVMLLTRDRFATFTPLPVADATRSTAGMVAVQLESRAAVDAMMATALAQGGTDVRPAEDHGWMYGRAFADLDGHIWEPFWAQMPETEVKA